MPTGWWAMSQKSTALGLKMRDTDKVAVFLRDFKEFESNYDSTDPEKRLPNYIVMSMPEDHTRGTAPGAYTPHAMVANNDYAIGQLVDAVSHSRYWPNTAIFIIEDDAQDGADHVDGRRTVGLVDQPVCEAWHGGQHAVHNELDGAVDGTAAGAASDEPVRCVRRCRCMRLSTRRRP